MQGIYTYIPETNYVPREYGVAAILLLLFMALISLVPVLNRSYFYISTFRSMCAVPNMAVFCSFLTSWLLTYFLNDFETVPVAPVICYCYHLCFYLPQALYFYCKVFIFWNLVGFFWRDNVYSFVLMGVHHSSTWRHRGTSSYRVWRNRRLLP